MAIYMWREYIPEKLCFTAITAGSTVQIQKYGSPAAINLETSTDWNSWSDYTFGTNITLSNVWDKVCIRNKSDVNTSFSLNNTNYYQFLFGGWYVAWSWDINYLINKNSTTVIPDYCFTKLFYWCSYLSETPILSATTLWQRCYSNMFYNCTWLRSLPKIMALSYPDKCCMSMFYWCVNIELSETHTWGYVNEYRLPFTWTWTDVDGTAFQNMFTSTWWTFTGTPTINTTYYTSNQVI